MSFELWLKKWLYDGPEALQRAVTVTAALDIPVESGGGVSAFGYILDHIDKGDDELLDVMHATLHVLHTGSVVYRYPPHEEVERHLAYAHSIWMATERGLVNRSEPTAQDAFTLASTPADAASAELREAWNNAYDRDGDPSDAWDHAIKAVEAVLITIVVPQQTGAHVGHVVGQLDNFGDKWDVGLRFNQTDPPKNPPHNAVQALVGMLRLIYPNPDRHLGSHREPTAEEARIIVQLATTVVLWSRDGQIVRK
jgi:hypothetical protein